MRKIRSILLTMIAMLLFFSPILVSKSYANNNLPNVSAHSYVIMDSKSGEILYSKNASKKIYPASTAKMMTALVAVENCSLSKKITVKQSVLSNIHPDLSVVGIKAGSTYTLEELLNMLLIYSGADAADTIAVEIAGSVEAFAKMMTSKAKELGMNNTNFDNAIGADFGGYDNTYSTASDIAKLTRQVMKNKTIRNIVSKPSYTIKSFNNGGSKTIKNTNKFLNGQYYPSNLYKIIGTKTGTTDRAGYVLSTTAIDNYGREIICSFFGNSTRTKMYENIESLLTYTYKNVSTKYGWRQSNGKWYYYDKSGSLKKGWLNYNGDWYYLKSNGEMATGWLYIGNYWYYLKDDGAMAKGWLYDKGSWYYLKDDGSMAKGWLYDKDSWYYLKDDGSMAKGWLYNKGSWYYLKDDGSMAKGWLYDKDSWYYLKDDGSMAKGWLYDKDSWYYLKDNGSMAKGWLYDKDSWYYLKDNGSMAKGWLYDKDSWYYLKDNGSMVTDTVIDGWIIDSNGVATPITEEIPEVSDTPLTEELFLDTAI